jgi:hypothetical protein
MKSNGNRLSFDTPRDHISPDRILKLGDYQRDRLSHILLPEADLPELMFLKEWPAHDMSVDEFRKSSSHLFSPEKMSGAHNQMIADVPAFMQKVRVRLKQKTKDNLILTLFTWGFLLWPMLAQEVFGLFSCYLVDGKLYIFGETEVQCYEGEHWFWAAAVGVPGLVMALGFPVSVWLSLRAYRDDFWVCEISATRKFAFLFADYKPTCYYWEAVGMLRKLGVMLSAVCLVSAGVMTQAWCCLAVIAVAMLLHLRFRPYAHWLVDHLETASLSTCFFTLYLGIMLELHKGSFIAIMCSVTILLFQAGFFLFFLYTLKESFKDMARTKQDAQNIPREKQVSCSSFFFGFIKDKITCAKAKETDDDTASKQTRVSQILNNRGYQGNKNLEQKSEDGNICRHNRFQPDCFVCAQSADQNGTHSFSCDQSTELHAVFQRVAPIATPIEDSFVGIPEKAASDNCILMPRSSCRTKDKETPPVDTSIRDSDDSSRFGVDASTADSTEKTETKGFEVTVSFEGIPSSSASANCFRPGSSAPVGRQRWTQNTVGGQFGDWSNAGTELHEVATVFGAQSESPFESPSESPKDELPATQLPATQKNDLGSTSSKHVQYHL